MKIFLSHASEQKEVARSIEIALRGEGHTVFLDSSVLQSGEAYNDKIREAIGDSDLFIFLISPEAVSQGRYALNELELAEQRWPRASGHLLPVMIQPVAHALIPPYLRGVTILEPQGDVPAAVAAAVARLSRRWWHPTGQRAAALVLAVALMVGATAWWGYQHWLTGKELSTLLDAGALQQKSGNYEEAWNLYERAESLAPGRHDVTVARERLAMDWLDNIRITTGQATFTGIVEKVGTVLSRCAVSGEAKRAADCLAHQGWGDFLRSREGAAGLDPVQYYRRALEAEPSNVYGHAMWGFDMLRSGAALPDAMAQFSEALASGRESAYVRHLEIAGLLWRHDPDAENEAIRVANSMRVNGERMTGGDSTHSDAWRLWNIYYDRLVNRNGTERFLAALPASEHVATFRWMFPEDRVPPDKRNLYLFMLATFEDNAGERSGALATYRRLQDSLRSTGDFARGGPIPERTTEAIGRLSKAR